jgi:hypothetical protein
VHHSDRSLGSNADRHSGDQLGAIALTAEHLKKRRYQFFPSGMGTTLIILGTGFGGGLMMATSALKEPIGYQS